MAGPQLMFEDLLWFYRLMVEQDMTFAGLLGLGLTKK